MRGHFRLEVQIVHENQQDPAARVPHLAPGCGWQHNPLGRGGRRRRNRVVGSSAVHERERLDLLRNPVFEHGEVVPSQIRNEGAL